MRPEPTKIQDKEEMLALKTVRRAITSSKRSMSVSEPITDGNTAKKLLCIR